MIGRRIIDLAEFINYVAYYFFGAIVVLVIALVLLRYLVEALRLSPFGNFAYYATRPANEMLRNMRQSRFYLPLKRTFGFDPAIVMLILATAILCYVAYSVISNFTILLQALANSFLAFGYAQPFTGAKFLLGAVLLAGVFFLMALMTIIFINWLFGLFSHVAYLALHRLQPLLNVFEFGGALAGFSFIILWFVLTLAAGAIQFIFFSGLRSM